MAINKLVLQEKAKLLGMAEETDKREGKHDLCDVYKKGANHEKYQDYLLVISYERNVYLNCGLQTKD